MVISHQHYLKDIIDAGSSSEATLTNLTAGSVVFSDGLELTQDNSNFFYLDSANQLLLGGTTAAAAAIILGADGSLTVNEQGASVTTRIEASGVSDAFQVNGADGEITLGALGSGVAHSSSGGVISSSAVSLTADISGILPIANGGTNQSSAFAAGSLVFSDGTRFTQDNSNLFWDDSNNEFGIGTTSPDGILHLDNGTSDTDLILEKDAGTSADIIFHNAGAAAAHIAFDSNEDIIIENDTADKDIIFKILDGAADTEVMRIDGSVSSVGIGTTAPSGILHLDSGTSDTELVIEKDLGTNANIVFNVAGTDSAHIGYDTARILVIQNDTSDRDIMFKINDGGVVKEVMRIDASANGSLGIGLTNPTNKVHIQGDSGSTLLEVEDTTDVDNHNVKIGVIRTGDFPGVWFNTNAPTISNYAFQAGSSDNTLFNSPASTGKGMNFRIGNNEAMLIFDSRGVGIGDAYSTVASTDDPGANILIVEGKIGIGISAPIATLDCDGSAIFNTSAANVDFIIKGDTATSLFVGDAGLDAIQIGDTTAGVIADFRSAIIVFNEDGADQDFRVEASGVADAISLNGADGVLTIGALGAGILHSTSGGVISSSTVDISIDTNLTVSSPIVLTDDNLSFDFSTVNTWTANNTFDEEVIHTAHAGVTTDGAVWNDTTQDSIQTFVNGIEQSLSGVIFTSTANANIINTTTETTLVGTGVGVTTLPANFFMPGKTIRVMVSGDFVVTTAGSMQIKVKLGSTVMLDTASNVHPQASKGWRLIGLITCRTAGASGAMMCQGQSIINSSAIAAEIWDMENNGTIAVDTTGTLVLGVTGQWSTASALLSFTSLNVVFEVLN